MISALTTMDSEYLAKMHRNCFGDYWNADDFRSMLSKDVFWGFVCKKDVYQGFILCKTVCSEIEIITFCVLPEFRNLGVGKTLIREIDAYAFTNHAHQIFLEVSENNTVARKIYKDFGYKEISRRTGYYQIECCQKDAIVMQKIICPPLCY